VNLTCPGLIFHSLSPSEALAKEGIQFLSAGLTAFGSQAGYKTR